jgi:hypothetical protein
LPSEPPLASAQRVALSCGPISLGKTSMLGTTAALREAKQGSEAGPPSSDARQLQCPSWAAVGALASRRPRLSPSTGLIVHRDCLRSQPASGLGPIPLEHVARAIVVHDEAARHNAGKHLRAPQRGTTPARGCPSRPSNGECSAVINVEAADKRASMNPHQSAGHRQPLPPRRLPAPRPPGREAPNSGGDEAQRKFHLNPVTADSAPTRSARRSCLGTESRLQVSGAKRASA